MATRRKNTGFTIVELLIVIVVIGILAAIVIVAFNGVQSQAQNTLRINEIKSWQKTFDLYKAQYGNYPAMGNGQYCLGNGFLVGGGGVSRCRDYEGTSTNSIAESTNEPLMTELAKVASIPKPSNVPARSTLGPYATYTASQISIIAWIRGGAGDCPGGTEYSWDDSTGERVACAITLTR